MHIDYKLRFGFFLDAAETEKHKQVMQVQQSHISKRTHNRRDKLIDKIRKAVKILFDGTLCAGLSVPRLRVTCESLCSRNRTAPAGEKWI